MKTIKTCFFFLSFLLFSFVFSFNFSDFDKYQNRLTRNLIEKKLHLFLQKDLDIENYYILTDNSFILYSSPINKKKNIPEYVLQLQTKPQLVKKNNPVPPKKPIKIAIDPGHFGGILARLEERFVPINASSHTVLFDEGTLNYLTALHLKDLLVKEGFDVFLTRKNIGKGVYDIDFFSWLDQFPSNYFGNRPLSRIFRGIYNTLDLKARAKSINEFNPDLTIIIHYNAHDEKGASNNLTKKNFNLVFIPGAFCRNEMKKKEDRYEFMRLLVTDHLEKSFCLSQCIAHSFEKILLVPLLETDSELSYLNKFCMKIDKGVFARNLGLTRRIQSTLCYGETLIQNNEKEIT